MAGTEQYLKLTPLKFNILAGIIVKHTSVDLKLNSITNVSQI